MRPNGKFQIPAAIGLMLIGLILAVAAGAHAEGGLSGPGGVYVPLNEGDGDETVEESSHWRLGAEIEGDEAPADIGSPEQRKYDAIRLRPMATYSLRARGVTPYLGGGVEFKMDPANYGPPDHAQPVGVAGVRVPLGGKFHLFGEGRWRPEVSGT
ncbi:MAG: hypothetical protein KC466_20650, partial [Myxococcales bacterium]|nr:hypothetical protein [Myxococcales bacterium]